MMKTHSMNSQHPMGGVQYSFPLLPVNEIISCLADLQIPINEEALKKPNSEMVRKWLENFIEYLVGTTPEEMSQPVFNAMEKLQYPELHEDSVNLLAFHRGAQTLMDACGIHDFSMRDYVNPEFQRLRRILSGVINFAKFREERLLRYQELSTRSESIAAQRSRLEDEHTKLQAEYDRLMEIRKAEEPEAAALRDHIKDYAAQMNELNKMQGNLQESIRDLKTKSGEVGDKLAEIKFALLNDMQEVSKLQAGIVQSPERVKSEIADMRAQLEHDKENVASIEHRSRKLETRAAALEHVEDELRALHKHMEECETEMNELRNAQKTCKENQLRITEQQDDEQRLIQAQAHINKQIRSVQERITRLQKQAMEKKSESDTILEQLHSEVEQAMREREAAMKRLEFMDGLRQQTSDKIISIRKAHEEEMAVLRQKYEALEQAVVDYHKLFFTSLKEI